MIFVDDLKWAWKVMFHPEAETKVTMDSIAAFIQYYKASFIPVVAVIIVEILLSGFLAGAIYNVLSSLLMLVSTHIPFGHVLSAALSGLIGAIALVLLILGTIFYAWIAIPFYLFVNSLIYHILGKYIFRVFKNEFDNTASAFVYSATPFAVFAWVIVIPIIGVIASLILGGWEITILVFSLSNQEGITKKTAGLIIFGIGIIAAVLFLFTGI
jgi:hypothetical protein